MTKDVQAGKKLGDSIRVFVRVRPPANNLDSSVCLKVLSDAEISIHQKSCSKEFTYDHVVDQYASQENVFGAVGKRIVEGCVEGYNGTIFAYGQTGSGKTHTMLGPSEDFTNKFPDEKHGVIPRSLEYLFQLIDQKKEMHGEKMEFLCKCSFFEIYQENIYDLLITGAISALHLRESVSRGVFVDGVVEKIVTSAEEAFMVLKTGWNNRHVATTAMNRESSRSHAVFTISIEAKDKTGGVTKVRTSLLNMVDLAGSERQRDTGTSGLRLKEAGTINKSLSVLGNVIMSLVDIENGRERHVPYRDSKLTFLLRDSVGGNARTCLIANVHPNSYFYGETLTTLQFAQRAKMIKNKARVNEDMHGDVVALQTEIKKLKQLLDKSVSTTPLQNPVLNGKYQDLFFDAMLLWKRDQNMVDELKLQLDAKEALVQRGNKALQSSRMIIKFRDSMIKQLKGTSPMDVDERVDLLNSEISTLREQLAHHPEVLLHTSKVRELESELQKIYASSEYKTYFRISKDKREKLLKEFQQIMETRSSEIEDLPGHITLANASTKEVTRLTEELQHLQEEHSEEKSAFQKRIEHLEAELAGSRKGQEELERMLNALQEGSRIKIKRLNSVHDSTIRTITTPMKEQSRKRSSCADNLSSSRKLLRSNSGEPVFNLMDDNAFNESKEFNLLADSLEKGDKFGMVALEVELEWEREEKVKVEQQVEEMQKQCGKLKEQLAVVEKKLLISVETIADLKSNFTSQEVLWKSSNDVNTKKSNQLLQDNQLKHEEIQDLRIALNSADKELREYKQNLSVVKNSFQKELSEKVAANGRLRLEVESTNNELERVQQNVQTLNEELATTTADRDFTNERLQEAHALVELKKEQIVKFESQILNLKEQIEQIKRLHEGNNQDNELALQELQATNQALHMKLTAAVEQNAVCEKSIAEFKSDLRLLEKAAHNDKDVITSMLKELTEVKESLSDETNTSDGLRSEVKDLQEKLTSLADEIVAKTESNNTLQRSLQQIEEKHKNDISLLQFELENLQDDLGSLTDINTALEADVQKREADLLRSRATHQEEQDRWKRDLEERSQQNKELRRKLDVAIQDQENRGVSDAEILRLETQLKERSEEFNKLSATQDEIVQLYNSSRERCSAFKEEVTALHVRLGSADNKVSALQVELTNVQTVNEGLNDELLRMNEKNQSLNDCIDATTLSSTMLSEKIERLEVENANLHKEAAILAGHTNHRQKIHYLSKVKNDLVAVTNERNLLEAQCAKQVEDLRKYGHIFNTSTSQVRRSKSPIPDGINSSVP